jgi:hypothetical protein
MITNDSSAVEDAHQAARGGFANRFVERLADRIGAQADIKAVFGEPIERDGLTVVPVARVRWGFGGGDGSGEDAEGRTIGSGSGGGGGLAAEPIGYIEIGPDGAAFRPITPPYPSPWFLLASGITAAIVLRALARVAGR